MKMWLVLSFVLFMSGVGFSQTLNAARLDSFFSVLARNNKMMGSVAVKKGGSVVYRRSVGYSKYDAQKLKANDTTCYRIGSVTKMFTATMIFQLIEAGKLSLSTPLSDYFPGIPNASEITVALLLNHRSGLYDFVNDNQGMKWLAMPHTTDDIMQAVAKPNRDAKPNTKFSYSNSAYFLLAKIIEEVTRQSYDANLQSSICAVLGLRHTYSSRDNSYRENAAIPYSFSGAQWAEVTDMWFPNVTGVGDIESTPIELATFCQALLNGQLINTAGLKSMTTMTDPPFGMGIMHQPFFDHVAYGHGGDTYGSHAYLAYFPADSLAVAICINGESYSRYGIYADVLSICFNEDYERLDFEKHQPDTKSLGSYVGVYVANNAPLRVTITLKKGKLYAKTESRPSSELIMVTADEFCFKQTGFFVWFRPAKGDMVLTHSAGTLLLKRQIK